ncbi:MAG: superoxide dismutase [Chlamydiales bacterium]|nr:superoxide dismutase [Chlamydiia bacterium]MCP5505154.1 superoxide dismutase [Chlamydiales bacterium]
MAFKQPQLPYDLKALAPFVSEEQMDYHYNKHHAAYFKNLNRLVEGKPEEGKDLDTVVKDSSGGIFNNAAQAWNHTFFWECMSPNGGGKPKGELLTAIEKDFGSLDDFMKKFSDSAATLFGSGWAWLASDSSGKLEIMPLSNADTPLKYNKTPILTLDVWEHAYYIDYRNERPRFIEQFRDVIHWDFAEKNYKERG